MTKCIDCKKVLSKQQNPPKRCKSCNNRFRWSDSNYKLKVGKKISSSRIELGTARGEKNPRWKGEDVGYGALHRWVTKILGKPSTCQYCRVNGLKGTKIHWANISRSYKRDQKDWIRLCAKCHKMFDKSNKQYVYENRKKI